MPSLPLERWVVVAGGVAVSVLLVLNVLAWRDYRREDPRSQGDAPSRVEADAPAPAPRTETATTQEPPATEGASSRSQPAGPPESAAPPTTLVVRAARGDSWLEVRVGSETGTIRYRNTLLEGDAVRVTGPRLWLRIGVGQNLDFRLNGEQAGGIPAGTATVVATPRGLETVSVG